MNDTRSAGRQVDVHSLPSQRSPADSMGPVAEVARMAGHASEKTSNGSVKTLERQPDLPHSDEKLNDAETTTHSSETMPDQHRANGNVHVGEHDRKKSNGSPDKHPMNGTHKPTKSSESPDQGLGILVEHSYNDTNHTGRTSVVDMIEGPDVTAALAGLSEELSSRPVEEKDKILKLSSERIQELTASPESIPYRAAPEVSPRRRVVSDNTHTNGSIARHEIPEVPLQPLSETSSSTEDMLKLRPSGNVPVEPAPASASPEFARPRDNQSVRVRPHASRTLSTPSSSHRTLPNSPHSERLAQTWSSRLKQDRHGLDRVERDLKTHLNAPPQTIESPKSPMPPSLPLPPVSIPTYLQLELASGRPSPLYIHRSSISDFPYESSRVKLERLVNFLMLPLGLEQVLWFGALACLDSWLYSFTILPLRFIKALYILCGSWVKNLDAEIRFVWIFVLNGIWRVWRRKTQSPTNDGHERRGSEPDATPRLFPGSSGGHDAASTDRESRYRHSDQSRRRHRTSESRKHHRRQKSVPSALLPDDKADILTGLLMLATCCVLMYFDASRMYHWIRGQAAIKLYVIYNVLEVSDRLLAALGQDVLECLFSREALERRPDGRSKIFRPFWLFLLALVYTVTHAISLFYQVMTLNVAVNAYSNALITLLLSNQFVEIKSTVFRKFEKENLFQLTCADVVERFQLWLMLTIIASRNIVETGAFNFVGNLGLGSSFPGQSSTSTNSTPLSTPPRTASSIVPQSFTFFPSSILSSLSSANSFLPTLAQVLGPFLVVLGSEMLVDWLKHAYINKFNNTRPTIYGRFLDVLAKDYYTNAFGDQNLTRRLGLPVIPLSCLFFRVSVQTYQMFLAALLPQSPSSTAMESTSLSSIHNHYAPAPVPSAPPLSFATLLPASSAHINAFFRTLLANAIPSPAQSVQIFTVVLLITGFIVLLILKLLLGMVLLAFARSRYKKMKRPETEPPPSSHSSSHHQPMQEAPASRTREFVVEGSRRIGGWSMVEVSDEKRQWIYADDPEGLRRLKEKEERDRNKDGEMNIDHVQRYEMVAKKIW